MATIWTFVFLTRIGHSMIKAIFAISPWCIRVFFVGSSGFLKVFEIWYPISAAVHVPLRANFEFASAKSYDSHDPNWRPQAKVISESATETADSLSWESHGGRNMYFTQALRPTYVQFFLSITPVTVESRFTTNIAKEIVLAQTQTGCFRTGSTANSRSFGLKSPSTLIFETTNITNPSISAGLSHMPLVVRSERKTFQSPHLILQSIWNLNWESSAPLLPFFR